MILRGQLLQTRAFSRASLPARELSNLVFEREEIGGSRWSVVGILIWEGGVDVFKAQWTRTREAICLRTQRRDHKG